MTEISRLLVSCGLMMFLLMNPRLLETALLEWCLGLKALFFFEIYWQHNYDEDFIKQVLDLSMLTISQEKKYFRENL